MSAADVLRAILDENDVPTNSNLTPAAKMVDASLWKLASMPLSCGIDEVLAVEQSLISGIDTIFDFDSAVQLEPECAVDMCKEMLRYLSESHPPVPVHGQSSVHSIAEGLAFGHSLLQCFQQSKQENLVNTVPDKQRKIPTPAAMSVKSTQTDTFTAPSSSSSTTAHRDAADDPMLSIASAVLQPPKRTGPFMTAKDKLMLENPQKAIAMKKESQQRAAVSGATGVTGKDTKASKGSSAEDDNPLPPELAHCEKALVEKIEAEIVHRGQSITFAEIAGLEFAKKTVDELICWPMARPDLFQGLRALPRGLLLFGPPGTGKTLIGKAISHQVGGTFFSISASSLTSKWIGEGEKTVRTLFAVATYRQPSVIFIDELDSLLCQRSADENEASRRIKTEFLVQLDGAGTDQDAQVVILGATNRPEELDDAARRRFVKRLYIPLPDVAGRRQLLETLLATSSHQLALVDLEALIANTDGFSGADIRALCTEAAMGPVREVASRCQGNLLNVRACDMPPINMGHFEEALQRVAASVSQADLQRYVDWNSTFGSYRRMS